MLKFENSPLEIMAYATNRSGVEALKWEKTIRWNGFSFFGSRGRNYFSERARARPSKRGSVLYSL